MKHLLLRPFSAGGLLLGAAGVAAVTAVFSQLIPANSSTAGFFYLMVVLGAATQSGFRVSALISIAATVCFNFYFLPPVGRLTIAEPENWVALFTFLLTALVASHLSDRAQREAAEARRRQQETEQLYALSRAILLTEASNPIGTQAAQTIARVFDLDAVLLLDAKAGQTHRGGPGEVADWEQRMEETVLTGKHQRNPAEDLDIWPIRLGGNPIGALAARGNRMSDGAVQSMLNLVAIALERVRSEEAANRAEAARQSEEFKSTMLDAIAHEFKTPLTSIKAAVTGLRTIDPARIDAREDLTAIIEEETDRLSHLVTEAVRIAEIDAGKVKPRPEAVPARDLLTAARDSFEGRGASRISIEPGGESQVFVDRELMVLAIRQVVDNALEYSPGETPVGMSAVAADDTVTLRIADKGPGVPERERERIFEKFYRHAGTSGQVPGSGLGLHVAREIARIHGGSAWVEGGEPSGAVFCFRLPAYREREK